MAKVIAMPTTGEELREVLMDPKAMKELMQDPEAHADFIEKHINLRLKTDPTLVEQNKEAWEKFQIEWLREHGATGNSSLNFDPNSRRPVKTNTLYNKGATGAKFDGEFESLAGLTHGISNHAFKTMDLSKKLEGLQNVASSLEPSDGGFLIPEDLRAMVLQLALESAVVRSRARVMPMDSLRVPIPSVDSTSNVSSVFGGIIGFWTEEGATLTESRPRFGRIVLEAHKLTLYIEVPNELIRDSRPAYTTFIDTMFPEAISWFEDVAFFVGGGVGEPLGFLNAPARIQLTRSTTVAGNNVEWVDITGMYSRMLPQSLARAVWVISPDVLPSLFNMTIAGGTSPIWIGGGGFPDASARPPMSMLGIPIIVSEKARAVGTAGDINLVDFGHYLIGDRQAMSVRQSEDFGFNRDVTAIRVIERLDGRPWLQSAITPQNGGATLSPFVQLTTAP